MVEGLNLTCGFSGFGIFVVKPDGRKYKIEKDFISFLKERGFIILKIREVALTPADLSSCYFFRSNKNVKYLCDGKVLAILVGCREFDFQDKIYESKMEYRRIHGIRKNEFYNLIHSSDEGLEFFRQRSLFFPEYVSPVYTIGVDMFIVDPFTLRGLDRWGIDQMCCRICSYDDYLGMKQLLSNEKKDFRAVYSLPIKLSDNSVFDVLFYQKKVPSFGSSKDFADYMHDQEFKKNCICVLGKGHNDYFKLPYELEKIDDPLEYCNSVYFPIRDRLKNICDEMNTIYPLTGLLIETAEFDLHESASRYFYSDDFGFLKSSGSGDPTAAGLYSVSHKYSQDFYGIYSVR